MRIVKFRGPDVLIKQQNLLQRQTETKQINIDTFKMDRWTDGKTTKLNQRTMKRLKIDRAKE